MADSVLQQLLDATPAPQRQSVLAELFGGDAFETAAARTSRAVRPEGGRARGATTAVMEKYVPHVLESLLGLPGRALGAAGELQRTGDVYDPGPALETATMMVGAPGVPRGAVGSSIAKPQGIKAYHGSPHDFERFDISKIGTGEGAQSYGHGLYFAENPKVAQEYRDVLTRRPVNDSEIDPTVAGNALFDIAEKTGGLINGKIPFGPTRSLLTREQIVTGFEQGKFSPFDLSPAMQRQIVDQIKPPGRMYEVNINARPEQFLDWDKPLAGQNPQVQNIYGSIRNQRGGMPSDVRTGGQIYDLIGDVFTKSGHGMKRAYQETAAEQLREAGIPGIKYLDQGSRTVEPQWMVGGKPLDANDPAQFAALTQKLYPGSGVRAIPGGDPVSLEARRMIEGGAQLPELTDVASRSSNYVMFRDDIIDILRKYGIAAGGPLGALMLGGGEAEAAQ